MIPFLQPHPSARKHLGLFFLLFSMLSGVFAQPIWQNASLQGASGTNNTQTTISTANLAPGVYILSAGGENFRIIKK